MPACESYSPSPAQYNDNFSASMAEYIDSLTAIAAALGVHLRFGSDFYEFRDFPKAQPMRSPVAPIFDPGHSEISPANGFWMAGFNDAGEIVHTQALCIVDLDGLNLSEHLQSHLGDYRPHGYEIDVNQSEWFLTPAASAITGRMAYHGELWLKGGPGGYRGSCLATILPRLMLAKSLLNWSPDFIIGIMEPTTVCRGLAAREGYMRVEQHSILWHQTQSQETFEEWIVWMTSEEARFNLRVPTETLRQLGRSNANVTQSVPEQVLMSA